jgi:hypothetical protein
VPAALLGWVFPDTETVTNRQIGLQSAWPVGFRNRAGCAEQQGRGKEECANGPVVPLPHDPEGCAKSDVACEVHVRVGGSVW